jgi:effector-binding domain-containing protein
MDPGHFDFEVGVPVMTAITEIGRVKPGELPATVAARTMYHGPYEGLEGAWVQFMSWIATNGHQPAADLWEYYTSGPESSSDPSQWRTELIRPVVPRK